MLSLVWQELLLSRSSSLKKEEPLLAAEAPQQPASLYSPAQRELPSRLPLLEALRGGSPWPTYLSLRPRAAGASGQPMTWGQAGAGLQATGYRPTAGPGLLPCWAGPGRAGPGPGPGPGPGRILSSRPCALSCSKPCGNSFRCQALCPRLKQAGRGQGQCGAGRALGCTALEQEQGHTDPTRALEVPRAAPVIVPAQLLHCHQELPPRPGQRGRGRVLERTAVKVEENGCVVSWPPGSLGGNTQRRGKHTWAMIMGQMASIPLRQYRTQ